MDRLWAPWRIEYLEKDAVPGCIFCSKPKDDLDAENLILYRGKETFVIMNRYPYSNGHLMIVPYRHTDKLEDLSAQGVQEAFDLLKHCRKSLIELMHPQGFNVGINMGKVAGAGIHEHIHMHIVPRWGGDTNFMPVLADVRVISEHLDDTYRKLLPHFSGFNR